MKKNSLLIIIGSSIEKSKIYKYHKKYKSIHTVNIQNNEIIEFITHNWIDEILFMNIEYIDNDFYEKLLSMGIVVHINSLDSSYCILHINLIKKLFKRFLDVLGAIIGLFFTIMLIPIVTIFIYKKSPGSIFFIQDRVGKNGKIFRCYKFRTMYLNAEKDKEKLMNENKMNNSLMFKLNDDPRIIGGKNSFFSFLRKHSLDEFPQFFNVLIGDMSLIGSRPPTIDEFKQYDFHHKIRLAVKPGLTGLWQISGRNNITDFEEILKLDKEYINNISLFNDLKILLKTIITVFEGKGAY